MTKLRAYLASIFVGEYKFTGRMISYDRAKESVYVELSIYDYYYESWTNFLVNVEELDDEDYTQFLQVRRQNA